MYLNRVKFLTATVGTGDVAVGAALSGYLTPASAGAVNGGLYSYVIEDGYSWELGTATYNTTGPVFARRVTQSTNSNNPLNLSGNATMFLTPVKEDLDQFDPYGVNHRLSGYSADDDEFATDTIGSYTQVLPTGTATWSVANHSINCLFDSIANNDIGCVVKPLTGWTDGHWIETCIRVIGSSVNYTGMGLVLTNGTLTSSNALLALVFRDTTPGRITVRLDWGTITNINSTGGSAVLDESQTGAIRLRLKRNTSTAYEFQVAPENGGVFFAFSGSASNPSFTPTHGGLFVMNFAQTNKQIAGFDYFRHMT